jgi:hypothetical protein
MVNIVYGAVGVIAVLLLLFIGAIIGWKARIAFENHNQKVIRQELTDEERRRFQADQDAFSAMINYNVDMAYGKPQTLADLAKE